MVGFIVRRLIGMVAVLFAISVVTFGIFNVIPNGDPAVPARRPRRLEPRDDCGDPPRMGVQQADLRPVRAHDGEDLQRQPDLVLDPDERRRRDPSTTSARRCRSRSARRCCGCSSRSAIGLYTALRAGKFADRFLTVLAMIGISMPVFWVGALLSYYLGFKAGIFPSGGYTKLTSNPIQWAYHLILPWTALSILFIGVYSRVVRSSTLDTINEDFVRTARAKGLSQRRVLLKHVLRNSLIPVISLWGLDFAAIIGGGAIVTEYGVQPRRRRPVRGRLDQLARRAAGDGDHDVHRVLRRPVQHDRGHRVRLARPEDPARVSSHMARPPSGSGNPEPRPPGQSRCSTSEIWASRSRPRTASSAPSTASRSSSQPRDVLAIVGESGSGKSVSVMTLMGLTRGVNARFEGYALFEDSELISASDEEMERVRGAGIAMIFQDPMTSLNPVYRIGEQIAEQIRAHEEISKADARDRTISLLAEVGIPRAQERIDAYPHELSGGMRQRVMIAMALSCDPKHPDRGRAHDGAGRDDPGADPGADQGAARPHRTRPSSS